MADNGVNSSVQCADRCQRIDGAKRSRGGHVLDPRLNLSARKCCDATKRCSLSINNYFIVYTSCFIVMVKLYLIWRSARFFAAMDGLAVPENMEK